jgi:hypothetical protein
MRPASVEYTSPPPVVILLFMTAILPVAGAGLACPGLTFFHITAPLLACQAFKAGQVLSFIESG